MTIKTFRILRSYLRDKKAASAIEYALLAAGIALVIMAALFGFADELAATFDSIREALAEAPA